ncbi:MAG: GPW/gp25 family protein [Actinomycetota bacterium]
MTELDYIGTGLTFPMGVNVQGGISLSGGDALIEQSIRIILSTALTERVMRPEFGCAVWDHVFAPLTDALVLEIADATREALKRWEPRIDLTNVDVVPDPADQSRVLIDLSYEIAATNERRNLVYPFYVIPGEGASA